MLLEVDHTTVFSYSEPATLGPHTVRLRPRCDAAQDVRAFTLDVDPAPAGRFDFTDRDGNHVTRLWWTAPTESLSLRTAATVETLRANPFDFAVFDSRARQVPACYPDAEREGLRAYLGSAPPPESSLLAKLVGEVAAEAGGEITPFLAALAGHIRERVDHRNRELGDPQASEETLRQGRGACRDAAIVFVDACRAMGIAARFVSGYQEGLPEDAGDLAGRGAGSTDPSTGPGKTDGRSGERHLHAWAEAYVPEAGWRGFDPSQGLAVADRHVALAAAATPRGAAPTEGSFGPAHVRARLETRLDVRVLIPPGPRLPSPGGARRDRGSFPSS